MPRSGQSICSTRPARGDRLVLVAHRVGDRVEIRLVVAGNARCGRTATPRPAKRRSGTRPARRRRERARCRCATSVRAACGSRTPIGRVARRRLAPRAAGIAEHALREPRKVGEILVDERVALAAEAGQTVLDVRRVARLAHLAVVDDVDAGLAPACARPRRRRPRRARRARRPRPARLPPSRTSSARGRPAAAGCRCASSETARCWCAWSLSRCRPDDCRTPSASDASCEAIVASTAPDRDGRRGVQSAPFFAATAAHECAVRG